MTEGFVTDKYVELVLHKEVGREDRMTITSTMLYVLYVGSGKAPK